jgi:hypothetical protein
MDFQHLADSANHFDVPHDNEGRLPLVSCEETATLRQVSEEMWYDPITKKL